MSQEKKIVKGGFRATLALLISIIALICSIIAYNRTTTETDLKTQLAELQTKMEKMKQETSMRLDKAREETANRLEKLGQTLRKGEGG